MNELLSNSKTLLALACIGALVVGFNLTLFGLMRGSKTARDEASKLGKAIGGGQAAQREQAAQLEALHQAVARLKSQPDEKHDAER
jgi:hypothetical protein